ncbi:MAG: phospholipid-binding protein, partial [Rhodanobacter sp.]
MQLQSDNFQHTHPIPTRNAFGKPGHPVELSDNLSPHLLWTDAPNDTRSFVLTC